MENGSARIDPEALLAQASWVRELARSLVASSEVDDVVQETWRVALERPPRLDSANSSLRGWLATVLRNLARRAQRAERAKRDHVVLSKRDLPSSEDAGHERVLLQRQLADAVLALAEPYKSAIVLRYFDELSPKEIAERQDISYDAARQRLSRGLSMLRTKLDRDYRGDRRAWSVVCLGLAAKKSAFASPFVVGGTAMSVKTGSVVAVLALVALLSLWWWSTSSAWPTKAGELVVKPSVDLIPSTTSSSPANSVASDARTAAPATPPAQTIDRDRDLHGIVLDPNGKAVAGANVEVLHNEFCEQIVLDLEHGFQQQSVAKSVTDARGEFVFALPLGRAFDLGVDAAGFAHASVEHCHAGERVEVRLSRGAIVRGRVLRARDRAPVVGVRVDLWCRPEDRVQVSAPWRTTLSDNSGAYSFAGVCAGHYLLQFHPTGIAGVRHEFELGETDGCEFDALLDEGFTLCGRVTDAASGDPIANAEVSEGWTFKRSVRTDLNGGYQFVGFSKNGYDEIAVRAVGYGRMEARVRPDRNGPPQSIVDVQLTRAHTVRGRVVDPSGAPVAVAYVAATAYDEAGSSSRLDWANGRTGSDGRFELKDVRRDVRHVLWLKKEGLATVAYVFPTNELAQPIVELGEVRMSAPAILRGELLDDEGRAIARHAVSLSGVNADVEALGSAKVYARAANSAELRCLYDPNSPILDTYLGRRTTRTDDLGRFSFGDLAAGTYTLRAQWTGKFEDATLEVPIESCASVSGLKLAFARGESIEGRVVASDGTPVEWIVRCVSNGVWCDVSSHTDAQGRFKNAGLVAGTYTVLVEPVENGDDAAHHPTWIVVKKEDIASGSKDLEIVVPRGAPISGGVLDAKGEPATSVRVFARSVRDQSECSSQLDAAGHFELWLADDQSYDLVVRPNIPGPMTVDLDGKHAVEVLGVKPGGAPVVIRMP